MASAPSSAARSIEPVGGSQRISREVASAGAAELERTRRKMEWPSGRKELMRALPIRPEEPDMMTFTGAHLKGPVHCEAPAKPLRIRVL